MVVRVEICEEEEQEAEIFERGEEEFILKEVLMREKSKFIVARHTNLEKEEVIKVIRNPE